MRFVVACLFLSFPQIPISLARCAHFSVSLFPSAAPIPPHLGVMAAGHRALWGTAERGGEYLPLGLGSRGLGAFCVPLSSPVCHPCGSKKREQPPLKHMTCSQRLLLGSFDHHHLYAFSPFVFQLHSRQPQEQTKTRGMFQGKASFGLMLIFQRLAWEAIPSALTTAEI